jgi:Na+-driven multidrug efflux pump
MIAAYNFCTFTAMLLFMGFGMGAAVFFHAVGRGDRSSLDIWTVTGVITIGVSILLTYCFKDSLTAFLRRCRKDVGQEGDLGDE